MKDFTNNYILSYPISKRAMLARCGMGLGSLGLLTLLQDEGLLGAVNPLAPKQTHFVGKAKAVIWIFVNGGPSHVDPCLLYTSPSPRD